MRTLSILFVALASFIMNASCSAQSNKSNELAVSQTGNVEVYYFHYSRRCVTCNSVESVSKQDIMDLYGDKVSFLGINLDEPDGEQKGKEIGVTGQTLLIVSGDTKINLTNEGFMNARNKPEKLKQLIKETIDPLL